MFFSALFYVYFFSNLAILITIVLFLLKKSELVRHSKLNTFLLLAISFLFLLGLFNIQKTSDFLTEAVIDGKWYYGNEITEQNTDTGAISLSVEKEYKPSKSENKKYLKYFDIASYLFWLAPGILFFLKQRTPRSNRIVL